MLCQCNAITCWFYVTEVKSTAKESYNSFFFVCLFCFVLFFWDRVSLYSPGCPGTHFVDQGGLELRNPPASASRVLGLKAAFSYWINCSSTPCLRCYSQQVPTRQQAPTGSHSYSLIWNRIEDTAPWLHQLHRKHSLGTCSSLPGTILFIIKAWPIVHQGW